MRAAYLCRWVGSLRQVCVVRVPVDAPQACGCSCWCVCVFHVHMPTQALGEPGERQPFLERLRSACEGEAASLRRAKEAEADAKSSQLLAGATRELMQVRPASGLNGTRAPVGSEGMWAQGVYLPRRSNKGGISAAGPPPLWHCVRERACMWTWCMSHTAFIPCVSGPPRDQLRGLACRHCCSLPVQLLEGDEPDLDAAERALHAFLRGAYHAQASGPAKYIKVLRTAAWGPCLQQSTYLFPLRGPAGCVGFRVFRVSCWTAALAVHGVLRAADLAA